MLQKKSTIIFFLVVSISAFAIYQYFKIPEGITPQSSNNDVAIARLSFWTSIVTLVIVILGLVEKIITKKNDD